MAILNRVIFREVDGCVVVWIVLFGWAAPITIGFVIIRYLSYRHSGGAMFWGGFFLDRASVIYMHHVSGK